MRNLFFSFYVMVCEGGQKLNYSRYQFNCSQLSVVCMSRKEFKRNNELVSRIGSSFSNKLHTISPVWLSSVCIRTPLRRSFEMFLNSQVWGDILWPCRLPVYVRVCLWSSLPDLLWRRYSSGADSPASSHSLIAQERSGMRIWRSVTILAL